MGITTPVEALPAIALGGLEKGVSPLEMASAYGTLADGGDARAAARHRRGQGPDGQGAASTGEHEGPQAISAAVAYLTTDILKGVIEAGTGHGGRHRPARGGQDGHDAGVPRRVVRRLHAAARCRRVGRLSGRRARDDAVHGRKVTGGSFPARDLGALHEGGARGRRRDGLPGAGGRHRARARSASTPACSRRTTARTRARASSSPTPCRSRATCTTTPQRGRGAQRRRHDEREAASRRSRRPGSRRGRRRSGERRGVRHGRRRRTRRPARRRSRDDGDDHACGGGGGADADGRRTSRSPSPSAPASSRVTFDASASQRRRPPLTLRWDFGDGDARRRARRRATRSSRKGEYTVTLRVTDGDGADGIASTHDQREGASSPSARPR